MIRSNLLIAAILGGALAIGCEKKENSAAPARTTPPPATPATPAAPDMPAVPATPTTQSMKEGIKTGAGNVSDAARSATQSAGSAIRGAATTRPSGTP